MQTTLYVQMAQILEEATEALVRGEVASAATLAAHAATLGRALTILADRASDQAQVQP